MVVVETVVVVEATHLHPSGPQVCATQKWSKVLLTWQPLPMQSAVCFGHTQFGESSNQSNDAPLPGVHTNFVSHLYLRWCAKKVGCLIKFRTAGSCFLKWCSAYTLNNQVHVHNSIGTGKKKGCWEFFDWTCGKRTKMISLFYLQWTGLCLSASYVGSRTCVPRGGRSFGLW